MYESRLHRRPDGCRVVAAACGRPSTGASNPYGAPAVASVAPVVASPTATDSSGRDRDRHLGGAAAGGTVDGAGGRSPLRGGFGHELMQQRCRCGYCCPFHDRRPQAGSGLNASLLDDESSGRNNRVTYAGPLYYSSLTRKRARRRGSVNGFGGPWRVVSPSGMQIV